MINMWTNKVKTFYAAKDGRRTADSYVGYPHYPVPAIRYHVDSGRTGVAIWNNSTVYDYSKSDYFNEHPVYEYP